MAKVDITAKQTDLQTYRVVVDITDATPADIGRLLSAATAGNLSHGNVTKTCNFLGNCQRDKKRAPKTRPANPAGNPAGTAEATERQSAGNTAGTAEATGWGKDFDFTP